MLFEIGSTLKKVNFPEDMRKMQHAELICLAQDIRHYMINVISQIGGHLGSGLGVVELTIALHYIFNTPDDKLIWDIGHQTYPHKILTGRRDLFPTIRQDGGISGFCKISESEYDVFGAGHSSTSISAALGMAMARDLSKENFNIISVIGDSAMTAGMAYEALNNAGHLHTKMLVILNDNDMSISPAVGALRNYLVKLISSQGYVGFRNAAKKVSGKFPKSIGTLLRNTELVVKDVINGANIFEALGFYYIGPVDGHDLLNLITILEKIRDLNANKPILLHVKTEKGHGYAPASNTYDRCHGISVKTPIVPRKMQDLHTKKMEVSGGKIGTTFITDKAKKDSKLRRRLAFEAGVNTSGFININKCLEDLIHSKSATISILPIGITSFSGTFEKNDLLAIKLQNGEIIGYGLARYSSVELADLLGKADQKPFMRHEYMYII